MNVESYRRRVAAARAPRKPRSVSDSKSDSGVHKPTQRWSAPLTRGGRFAAGMFALHNDNMSVLAVVDGPVELCVTRLRYAQIHGSLSGQMFTASGDRRHLCLSLHVSQAIIIVRSDRPSFVSRYRQVRSRQLGVLQTHRDMEPIENWGLHYSRIGQNSAQSRAAVGESGHLGGVDPAHGFEGSLYQCGDVDLCPGDGANDLAATVNRLDVADADFQVAFVAVTAPYEG